MVSVACSGCDDDESYVEDNIDADDDDDDHDDDRWQWMDTGRGCPAQDLQHSTKLHRLWAGVKYKV